MEKVKEILKKAVLMLMVATIFVSIFGENVLTAHAASDPLDTIRKHVEYIGHDWDKLAELYPSDEVDGYIEFFNNEENVKNNIGILNVNNAELIEAVEIGFNDAEEFLANNYEGLTVRTYAVGIDYSVNEEKISFSNGVRYSIMSLILEADTWKVQECVQIANPQKLIDRGSVFLDEYTRTIEMVEARNDGILINGNGEVFDTVGEIIEIEDKSISNSQMMRAASNTAKTKHPIPTNDDMLCIGYYKNDELIGYINKNGDFSSERCYIPFYDYCLGVAAAECRNTELNGSARRANILAIKTFTWHFYLVKRDDYREIDLRICDDASCDVEATDQNYDPDMISQNPVLTVDFNAMKNIWMECSDGYIFTAQYRDKYSNVNEGVNGGGQYGGILYQWGCKYLADTKKYNYKQIVRYYYNKSNVCEDSVTIFNSQKKCIK